MNKTWKTLGMTLLRGTVSLLVLVAFLLTILSFSVKRAIGERADYRRIVDDPVIARRLLDFARADLEAECLFYGLSADLIDEALSVEDAAAFSLSYVDAVYDAVFISGKLEYPAVDAARFRTPIAAQLAEEELENKEATIDELAAEFASLTTSVWRLGLSEKILGPIHRIVSHVWVVRFLNGGAVLAGVTAVLAAILLLLNMRRIRRQTFALTGTLTVGSMLLFVPLWLLHRYGIAEKLVLGDSPLRLFVVGWLNNVTAQLYTVTLWVLVACAVALVAATVWVVWPKRETPLPAAEIPEAE